MNKIVKNCMLSVNDFINMINETIKVVALMIEKIINLDKRGRSYLNSSRNYRNTTRSYKNDFIHYLK